MSYQTSNAEPETEPRPSKIRANKKPYAIEYRWPRGNTLFKDIHRQEWAVYGRYHTEEQRAQAFEALEAKEKARITGPFFEFRIPEA